MKPKVKQILMIKFLLKHTYTAMSIAATIGGLIGLIQFVATQDDYGLTLYKKSETNLVQKSNDINGVVITYKGQNVDSIYREAFTLTNTGKKALVKDFIFEPVTLTPKSGAIIIQAHPTQAGLNLEKNKFRITWDLLNPGESISFTLVSTLPLEPRLSGRIKEIPKINYRDELKDPPGKVRMQNISILWTALAIIAIYWVFDSIRLIRQDAKLQSLFNLAKTAAVSSIGRKEFITIAVELYTEYHQATPRLFVSPQGFSDAISSAIGSSGKMNNDALQVAHKTIIDYARHANLYTLRAYGIILGPMLFAFCLVRVLFAFV